MDSKPVQGKPAFLNNYVLGLLMVILAVVLFYFLTSPQTKGLKSSTIVTTVPGSSSSSGVSSTTIPSNPTTVTSAVFASIGAIYCMGGFNGTSIINSSYYTQLYNSSYYNISSALYWISSANYPLALQDLSCIQNGGSVYCIGGQNESNVSTTASYSALLAANGTYNWTRITPYPQALNSAQCVASNNYLYCIGGQSGSSWTNQSYYASLSPPGPLSWTPTTPYPTNDSYYSCIAHSGYVYCIGGANVTTATNATYYAPLTSSGIGAWKATTAYPTYPVEPSCLQGGGYVYCIGNNPGTELYNISYYAQVGSFGIGKWIQINPYPSSFAQPSDCLSYKGIIYCVGAGDSDQGYAYASSFYTPFNASGVGQWQLLDQYPTPISDQSCVAN